MPIIESVDNPWANIPPDEIDFCYGSPTFRDGLGKINEKMLNEWSCVTRSRSGLYLAASEYGQFMLSRGVLPSEEFTQDARLSFMNDLSTWINLLKSKPVDFLKSGVDRWYFSWKRPPNSNFPNILPIADMYLAFIAVRHCRQTYEDALQYPDEKFYRRQQKETQILLSQAQTALSLPCNPLRGDLGASERMLASMSFVDKISL